MAALSRDEYLKGGLEHTQKDRTLSQDEVRNIQRTLNGHSSMWAKILNLGPFWSPFGPHLDLQGAGNSGNTYQNLEVTLVKHLNA